MKLIYIAGAYTAPTAVQRGANVQRARETAANVAALGGFPVTPHQMQLGIEDAGDEPFWYEGTMELMRRCDAVVVAPMSAASRGVTREVNEAHRLGKPVFYIDPVANDLPALASYLAS